MFRKENGVTLVALVITIIVLLILAGVTISMVLGDDGIITNSTQADADTEKADVNHVMQLANLTVRTDVLAASNGAATRTGAHTAYDAAAIAKAFNANSTLEATSSGTTLTVVGEEATYTFEFDADKKTVTMQ